MGISNQPLIQTASFTARVQPRDRRKPQILVHFCVFKGNQQNIIGSTDAGLMCMLLTGDEITPQGEPVNQNKRTFYVKDPEKFE